MNKDKLEINMAWMLVTVGLAIVALLPQLLIVPIAGLLILLGYVVIKKGDKVEPYDVLYEVVGILLLTVAYVWPTLILIAIGFALSKAMDYK